MRNRTYVPFDVFSMQVDVPVSSMVRDADLGWTCGQCPLDREGKVLSPGDLVAQTGHVCDMIEGVLQRAGFGPQSVGKLNVYFVEGRLGASEAAFKLIRRRFAHAPVVVSIPVPHFYYDGMMIEVDVFAASRVVSRRPQTHPDVDLQITDGGEVVWASVRADLGMEQEPAMVFGEISSALHQHGLSHTMLLSDHWFITSGEQPGEVLNDALGACPLISNPQALVQMAPRGNAEVSGELAFCRSAVQLDERTEDDSNVVVYVRTGAALLWASGVCGDAGCGLVEQTRQIMSGIDRALTANGLTFNSVTKLTAHYAGGASSEDLHGNMQVRHSFYSKPGPASTGLPVSGFHGRGCLISIDAVAVR